MIPGTTTVSIRVLRGTPQLSSLLIVLILKLMESEVFRAMGNTAGAAMAACILLSVTIIITYRKKSSRSALPPGPRGWPIVGNLPGLGEKLHEDLFHLAKKYGPLMTLQMGRKTTIVVSSPEMAKEVLKTNDAVFSSRTITEAVRSITYDASSLVFVPYGERWRLLRKILTTEVFSSGSIQSLEPVRRKQVDAMLGSVYDDWKHGNGVNIASSVFVVSANLVSHVVSGKSMFERGSAEGQRLKDAVWDILEVVGAPNVSDLFPFLRWFDPQGHRRKISKLYGRLDCYFDELIEERRSRKRNGTHSANGRKDMLDVFMEYEGGRFSPVDIKGMLSDMFIAGTDTTSSTVEWGMTEILRKPEILRRIQAEMEEVVGLGQKVEESHISRLPYLQAAVKEVFRLHPGVPLLIPRRTDCSCEIAGFRVPKDATVFVNVWGMGRDPKVWGDNSLEFLPERFLGSNIDVKGHHFELLPFGTGRRSCAGMPLGHRMVHFTLASLLHSFDWSAPLHNLSDLSEKVGITLQKASPLVAVPTPRLPASLY